MPCFDLATRDSARTTSRSQRVGCGVSATPSARRCRSRYASTLAVTAARFSADFMMAARASSRRRSWTSISRKRFVSRTRRSGRRWTETPPTPTATCDRTKPFGAPVLVTGLAADAHAATPRRSSDEVTLYVTTHVGTKPTLARTTRTSRTAPFGALLPLTTLASPVKDNDPSVSADGLSLWFSSERNGTIGNDSFLASRAKPTDEFTSAAILPRVNAGGKDQHPYFRATSGDLWLSSQRAGKWEIYFARKKGAAFEAPIRVEELRVTGTPGADAPADDHGRRPHDRVRVRASRRARKTRPVDGRAHVRVRAFRRAARARRDELQRRRLRRLVEPRRSAGSISRAIASSPTSIASTSPSGRLDPLIGSKRCTACAVAWP